MGLWSKQILLCVLASYTLACQVSKNGRSNSTSKSSSPSKNGGKFQLLSCSDQQAQALNTIVANMPGSVSSGPQTSAAATLPSSLIYSVETEAGIENCLDLDLAADSLVSSDVMALSFFNTAEKSITDFNAISMSQEDASALADACSALAASAAVHTEAAPDSASSLRANLSEPVGGRSAGPGSRIDPSRAHVCAPSGRTCKKVENHVKAGDRGPEVGPSLQNILNGHATEIPANSTVDSVTIRIEGGREVVELSYHSDNGQSSIQLSAAEARQVEGLLGKDFEDARRKAFCDVAFGDKADQVDRICERVSKDRGGEPISDNERLIIFTRMAEIDRLMKEFPGKTVSEILAILADAGVLMSGANTVNKLDNNQSGRSESLHVVFSVLVNDLGGMDRLGSMSRADRIKAIEEGLQKLYKVSPTDLIFRRVVDAIANLAGASGTIDHTRFRSTPIDTVPTTKEEAQKIVDRRGNGTNSTATTMDDALKFVNPSETRPIAILVYPPGTRGVAINGEGPVAKTACELQKLTGNVTFVFNEIMTSAPKDGFVVKDVSQRDLTINGKVQSVTVIQLEPRTAPTGPPAVPPVAPPQIPK